MRYNFCLSWCNAVHCRNGEYLWFAVITLVVPCNLLQKHCTNPWKIQWIKNSNNTESSNIQRLEIVIFFWFWVYIVLNFVCGWKHRAFLLVFFRHSASNECIFMTAATTALTAILSSVTWSNFQDLALLFLVCFVCCLLPTGIACHCHFGHLPYILVSRLEV